MAICWYQKHLCWCIDLSLLILLSACVYLCAFVKHVSIPKSNAALFTVGSTIVPSAWISLHGILGFGPRVHSSSPSQFQMLLLHLLLRRRVCFKKRSLLLRLWRIMKKRSPRWWNTVTHTLRKTHLGLHVLTWRKVFSSFLTCYT